MTLKELLDQNKDKFVDGRLKVRRDIWNESRWFEVVGVGADSAIGFEINGCGSCYPFHDNGNEWELFTEPKPKKKLWPFLTWSNSHKGKVAFPVYCESEDYAKRHFGDYYAGPVPGGEPIEVEE